MATSAGNEGRFGAGAPLRQRDLPALAHGRGALTVLLCAAVLLSLLRVPWGDDLVRPGGVAMVGQVLGGMLKPDLAPEVLGKAAAAAWQTIAYAVTGMTVALAMALPLGALASGTLVRNPVLRRVTMVLARGSLGLLRAIHELVWAWLFVAALGLSPVAAIAALAIPYAGILGRIYADLLNDVPPQPVTALQTTGAGLAITFLYARIPLALPDMISYTFYRFECGLRSAAILSFVGLGGLGFQIQIALDDLLFGRVATYLLVLVALILAVDTWSSQVRRRLTQ